MRPTSKRAALKSGFSKRCRIRLLAAAEQKCAQAEHAQGNQARLGNDGELEAANERGIRSPHGPYAEWTGENVNVRHAARDRPARSHDLGPSRYGAALIVPGPQLVAHTR